MNVSSCPNCGVHNFYRSQDVSATGPYGPNLLPGLGGLCRSAKYNLVVCSNCGLTRFFASPEATEKLAQSKKWKHIDSLP